jgi:hypothetical protein
MQSSENIESSFDTEPLTGNVYLDRCTAHYECDGVVEDSLDGKYNELLHGVCMVFRSSAAECKPVQPSHKGLNTI